LRKKAKDNNKRPEDMQAVVFGVGCRIVGLARDVGPASCLRRAIWTAAVGRHAKVPTPVTYNTCDMRD